MAAAGWFPVSFQPVPPPPVQRLQEVLVPLASVVMICLMAFVLLGPTLMVAVLVSGLSRRPADPTPDVPLAPVRQ